MKYARGESCESLLRRAFGPPGLNGGLDARLHGHDATANGAGLTDSLLA
jgi:hypothetical protein